MDSVKMTKLIVVIVTPIVLLLAYIFREQIMLCTSVLGPCAFHEVTGWHCPGCGNTRALRALLHLHPIISLRNNPMIMLLTLTGLGFYIEFAFDVCGKKISFMPKNQYFWLALLGLLLIFYVVRNFFPILAPIS